MSAAALLDIRDLTVHFSTIDGTLRVLEQVNLHLKADEIVGVVGETGCGKSVTVKLLLGILPQPPADVLSGSILLDERNLIDMPRKEREKTKEQIAYIPQDPMSSLNPTFAIGELFVDAIVWRRSGRQVWRYLRLRRKREVCRKAEQQAAELLDRVNIPAPRSVLDKYPIQLSGGMRQRVLMAMALIGRPKILVADEPTTALDVTIQKRILQLLLDKVDEEHLSGIYITHDLGVARIVCHRTYVMYAGTIVESGRTAEILDDPLHPYTQGLVRSIPKLTRESFQGIAGVVPDYLTPPGGCRFHPRCRFRFPECSQRPPELMDMGDERQVACHLFSEDKS
jgi:oligopeptide/dipeptide ABC transporter ATP-binding protein